MHLFGLFLNVGILWFLITLFTRSTNARQSLTETWIVIIGMLVVGVMARWLIGPFLGPLVGLVEVAALYLLVDKVCGASRSATIRICAWYFGISLFLGLISLLVKQA
jgi:hypothetical protein